VKSENQIDYQKTLRDIAKSMVRLKRPKRLLRMITRLIDRHFGLTHTSLLIYESKNSRYTFVDSKGSGRLPLKLIKMEEQHQLVVCFQKLSRAHGHNEDYVSRGEMQDWLEVKGEKAPAMIREDIERIVRSLDDFKAELAVPGYYKERLIGLLLLGRKHDHSAFTEEEISFFQILVQDCSMALKTSEYHQSLVEQNEELERRLGEIETLRKKEHETYYQIMRALAQEVHAKDSYTFGHIGQVERLGMMTARELGMDLSGRKKDILSAGLILHDVGKIGIPDHILKKQSRLDDDEWKIMRTHPEKGAKILAPLTDFKEVAEIVLTHHERWDGSGYPRGIKGEQIPVEARIVSVVDSFHAIVSTRCYSQGRPVEVALDELKRCAGSQFDPAVVEAFTKALKREMKKRGVGFFLEDSPADHRAA
jgi:HD-GYP domain-containing protein (c-di-GMP phosphodiesterase class II)